MMFAAQQIAARMTMPAPSTTLTLVQSIEVGFRITARPASPSNAPASFGAVSISFPSKAAASATQSGVVAQHDALARGQEAQARRDQRREQHHVQQRDAQDHRDVAPLRDHQNVLSVEVPSGGIQLVARLTHGTADQAAVKRLVAAGVETRDLSSLSLGKPRDHGLLLGFAAWRENEISAAVRTMASCF